MVLLAGPRQAGKTTLAKDIARSLSKEPKIYFFDTGLVKGDIGTRLLLTPFSPPRRCDGCDLNACPEVFAGGARPLAFHVFGPLRARR